ncbi:hypothetical protein EDC04DRAFT_2836658 [Pisolithus marmoratus]|nr:hypothetical protein EDC04DRAFT_2836658 [Pisolithus marmoratus]
MEWLSTTTASWPFDDLNAEVILRSSDNVDFRVFKCNLSLASPVFKDMFTLGARSMENTRRTLIRYRRFFSGNEHRVGRIAQTHLSSDIPKLDSINDIKALLAAVVKYDLITPAIDRATNLITSQHLESKPLSLYAIACCGDVEDKRS